MCSSPACRGFLTAAIVIGATLSLPASAQTKFTQLPATYDPATKVVTIPVKIDGICKTNTTIRLIDGRFGQVLSNTPDHNGDIFYFRLPNFPLGLHVVTVGLGGPLCDPASATFTYPVPNVDWLPTVHDLLLSD